VIRPSRWAIRGSIRLQQIVLRSKQTQPQGLIEVLLDANGEYGDRIDAASVLAAYDEPEAEDARSRVATDATEDENLLDHCGESLAEIWSRKGTINAEVLAKMAAPARKIAESIRTP
jgi:hypothetical protein